MESIVDLTIENLLNGDIKDLNGVEPVNIKLNVFIKLILNYLIKFERSTKYLNIIFNQLELILDCSDDHNDVYLINEVLLLIVTYLFFYNTTNVVKLEEVTDIFLQFFVSKNIILNPECLMVLNQFFSKVESKTFKKMIGETNNQLITNLKMLKTTMGLRNKQLFNLHRYTFKDTSELTNAAKVQQLISNAMKHNEDFVVHYESSIKILESPIRICKFLAENQVYRFDSVDAVIDKTINLFNSILLENEVYNKLRPLENKLNLSVSNGNFKRHLQDLGVNLNYFLENVDDSLPEDIDVIYKPLEQLSFSFHKQSLTNLSKVNITLINNKSYLKLLLINFFIKIKRFVNYLKDTPLFERSFDVIIGTNVQLKREIINSIKFGDLHYWRSLLIKHQTRVLDFMDNHHLNQSIDQLIKISNDDKISKNIPEINLETPHVPIPHINVPDKVIFKDHWEGIQFLDNKTDVNLEELNRKLEDYLNMSSGTLENKTQDDWCAYNILFKFSSNKAINFLLSEQIFKKTNIKEFFTNVYFVDHEFPEFKSEIENKISMLEIEADEKSQIIQRLKEENEKLQRILDSSDLTDFLEPEIIENDMKDPVDVIMDESESTNNHNSNQLTPNTKNLMTQTKKSDKKLNVENNNEKTKSCKTVILNPILKNEYTHESNAEYKIKIPVVENTLNICNDLQQHLSINNEPINLRSSRRRKSNLNYDLLGNLRKVQFEDQQKNYAESLIKLKNIVMKNDKVKSELSEADIKEEEESIKSEFDYIVECNTSLNNVTKIADIKLLKKTAALNTDELDAKIALSASRKRKLPK
ncbi:hypothetical protein QEN19_001907 [Hanseniaspora menglaensis]